MTSDSWPIYGIGFTDAVRRAYRKALVIDGRAGPGEYWWFVLFTLLVVIAMSVMAVVVDALATSTALDFSIPAGVALIAAYLAILVPGTTLIVRRLHDTGRSGWFYFTTFIPLVGSLILLILLLQSPRPEGLRYGPLGPGQPLAGRPLDHNVYIPPGSVWADSTRPAPPSTSARRSGRAAGIVVVCLVLVAGLAVGLAMLVPNALRQVSSSSIADDGWVETDTTPPTTYAQEPAWPGEAEPSSAYDEPTEDPEPTADPSQESSGSPADAPARTFEGTAVVVYTSDGRACSTDEEKLLYDSYPAATCKLWKQSTGFFTGSVLKKGKHQIACQRDLEVPNPTFTANQSNTWWVWAKSTEGTWDWFPETAIAEGVSDQAINGIALCEG